MPTGPLTGSQQ